MTTKNTAEKSEKTGRLAALARRRGVKGVLIAVVLAVVMIYHFAPDILPQGVMKKQVEAALSDWVGAKVRVGGDAEISFLPRPKVTVTSIAAARPDGAGPLLYGNAKSLTAHFGIFSALRGKTVLSDLTIDGGVLVIEDTPASAGAPQGMLAKMFATPMPSGAGNAPGSVKFIDSKLALDRHGTTEVVNGINGEIKWDRLSGPISATGSALIDGAATNFEFKADTPFSLLRGEDSSMSLKVFDNQITTSFSGHATRTKPYFLDGTVSVKTNNVKRLEDLLQIPMPMLKNVDNMSVSGTLGRSDNSLRFSPVTVVIDGTSGNGILDIARDSDNGTLRGMATLAFGDVKLPNIRTTLPGWIDDVTAFAGRGGRNTPALPALDLRLSAPSVALGDITLKNVAASIFRSTTQTSFDIADSQLGEGTLSAHVGITAGKQGAIQFTAENVDSATFLRQLGISLPISAPHLNLDAALQADVPFSDLDRKKISGAVKFSATDGKISGLDLAALFKRAETQRAFSLGFDSSLSLPFSKLSGTAKIDGVMVTLSGIKLQSDIGAITLEGTLNTLNGAFDITLSRAPADDTDAEPVVVRVSGNAIAALAISQSPKQP
ncbi:AsmA-like C-terminal region-containing protein [Martelella sp. HB161492]|uniref:AsmA family protein n=1 Tax=Martelella sp. HB161492 TaxID=2720726 RepID=UPI001591FE3D|nr:AsmA-like C-terminal region-containing protein [Martelella sp. HB161492]